MPKTFTRENQLAWAGICFLALGQAVALVAGVAGTRLAFSSLDDGTLSTLALILIAGAAILLAVFRLGLSLLAERVGQRYTADVRKVLLARAMAASPDQIAHRRRGYLMMRLTGDMSALKDGLARSLQPLVQALALLPAAVLALFWIDLRFGFSALALCGCAIGIGFLTAPRLRMAHVSLRKERARLAADVAERLPIAPALARLGRRDREMHRLTKATETLRQKAEWRRFQAEVLRVLPGLFATILAVGILYDGTERKLSAGELAAALAATGILAQTLIELAGAIDRLVGWQVARGRLASAFSTSADMSARRPSGLERLEGREVTVDFCALQGLAEPEHLRLSPGELGTIRASDPEWLARVLTKQTQDDRVHLSLNGIAVHCLTPGSVRRALCLISPNPILLKGSVRRNLCLGLMERPTDEQLLKRISKAGLTGSLQKFGGLNGHIGEGGRHFAAIDRLSFSGLQAAVQRPALIVVRPADVDLPNEIETFLKSGSATVLRLE